MSTDLPIRTPTKFDCEKAHRDSKHLTKLLHELDTQERFCTSGGSPTVQGIIISFMEKQKQRDLNKITVPASFKSVPIHLVDLPDNSTDPIVDAFKISEEYRQNQERTEGGTSAQQLTVQYASLAEEKFTGQRTEGIMTTQLTSTLIKTKPENKLSEKEDKKSTEPKNSMPANNEIMQGYTDVGAVLKVGPTSSQETSLLDSAKHEEDDGAKVSRKKTLEMSDSDSTGSREITKKHKAKEIPKVQPNKEESMDKFDEITEKLDSMDSRIFGLGADMKTSSTMIVDKLNEVRLKLYVTAPKPR